MGEVQSWVANHSILSKSPSQSSSSFSTTISQETHSTPPLCEDSSFNSLESNSTSKYYSQSDYPLIQKPSLSHFYITSLKTSTPQMISCLAVHHNNTLYAASTNEISVFDLKSCALIDTFGSGSGSIKSIAFNENKIFTAHQDCKIRVWKQHVINITSNVNDMKHTLISTLPTLKDRLFKCVLAKNYVQVRRHKQKLWIEHADAVSGLAVNNDVGLMYSISWDKSLKIWRLSSSDTRCLESVNAHSDAVNAVVVSSVDGTVYTGSADGLIKIWKSSGGSKKHLSIATLTKHESSVNALALTRDGSLLYSGGSDRVVVVWERGDNCEENNYMLVKCCLVGHKSAVLCLVQVNGVIISGSSDKSVRIWKHGKGYNGAGCCLAVLEGHCKPIKSLVAVLSDEDILDDSFSVLSGCLDGEIRVWKVVISDYRN